MLRCQAAGVRKARISSTQEEGRHQERIYAVPLLVRFLYRMRWPHSLHRMTSCCPIWFSAPQSVWGTRKKGDAGGEPSEKHGAADKFPVARGWRARTSTNVLHRCSAAHRVRAAAPSSPPVASASKRAGRRFHHQRASWPSEPCLMAARSVLEGSVPVLAAAPPSGISEGWHVAIRPARESTDSVLYLDLDLQYSSIRIHTRSSM